jgi:hypothetical protein
MYELHQLRSWKGPEQKFEKAAQADDLSDLDYLGLMENAHRKYKVVKLIYLEGGLRAEVILQRIVDPENLMHCIKLCDPTSRQFGSSFGETLLRSMAVAQLDYHLLALRYLLLPIASQLGVNLPPEMARNLDVIIVRQRQLTGRWQSYQSEVSDALRALHAASPV